LAEDHTPVEDDSLEEPERESHQVISVNPLCKSVRKKNKRKNGQFAILHHGTFLLFMSSVFGNIVQHGF
jgi:hypothetical protein